MQEQQLTDAMLWENLVTWGSGDEDGHEAVTHAELSRRVARLLKIEYAGRLEDQAGIAQRFCVPRDTICGDEARLLFGDRPPDQRNFLGGWVSHPLLATKAIVHPLAPGERAPPEWPVDFAEKVRSMVLTGYTAFTRDGALEAGSKLLPMGPVRIKAVGARGGQGQFTAADTNELARCLDGLEDEGLLEQGIVLEENLADVKTYSVGTVYLGELSAAYIGTQELTPNNEGQDVYGGSLLFVVRGGFADLLRIVVPDFAAICRLAINFDTLACEELGLIGSRRNYDVIAGLDHAGRRRRAVLEQSWRVGGASSAEIAALEAFQRYPDRTQIIASSVERYGTDATPPDFAHVLYRGNDPVQGPMIKYSILRDAL